jgi:PleD family two-component response regulator
LNDTDTQTAIAVGHRIRDNIRARPFPIHKDTAIRVEAKVTCVCAPGDGGSLRDLMSAARNRATAECPDLNGTIIH